MDMELEDSEVEMEEYKKQRIRENYAHFHHDPSECELIRINIAGRIYCTQKKTLESYPETLLGKLCLWPNCIKLLKICNLRCFCRKSCKTSKIL